MKSYLFYLNLSINYINLIFSRKKKCKVVGCKRGRIRRSKLYQHQKYRCRRELRTVCGNLQRERKFTKVPISVIGTNLLYTGMLAFPAATESKKNPQILLTQAVLPSDCIILVDCWSVAHGIRIQSSVQVESTSLRPAEVAGPMEKTGVPIGTPVQTLKPTPQ